MGAKLPDKLTYKDLRVFNAVEVEGKTLDQAAEDIGCSRDTIKRTKKRGSYRDLVLDAMTEQRFTVDEYTRKLISLTSAEKTLNCGGHDQIVPDNTTRMKAIDKIGKVFGDDCPRELDIKHSMQNASDEELLDELSAAVNKDTQVVPK